MVIDIAALAFVIVFSYFSMKKGAVGAAFKLCGTIIAIVVGMLMYPVVADWVYMTEIPDKVSASVAETIAENDGLDGVEESIDAMPKFIQKSVGKSIEDGIASVEQSAAKLVTRAILNIIVFILLSAVTKIIIMLLSKALKLTNRLPILKQCNALLGLALGLVSSLIIVWGASALISALAMSNEALANRALDSYTIAIMGMVSPF
ncbi:MAG: CvpA family protein [Clostridia bacterium]|nr:CvpA family protein [Clostridia bacterium]